MLRANPACGPFLRDDYGLARAWSVAVLDVGAMPQSEAGPGAREAEKEKDHDEQKTAEADIFGERITASGDGWRGLIGSGRRAGRVAAQPSKGEALATEWDGWDRRSRRACRSLRRTSHYRHFLNRSSGNESLRLLYGKGNVPW